ncbi:MAG: SRPBCC family protein [Myxococcales bacterium FL481]|nr:MAG: SRPBCC family protein [Myxococcales bacterium FL481]
MSLARLLRSGSRFGHGFLCLCLIAVVGSSGGWSLAHARPASVDRSPTKRVRPVMVDATLAPDGPNRVKVQAQVDVHADVDAVWAAVIDFDARVRENWLVDEAVVYASRRDGDQFRYGVRWGLSVAGVDVVYHTTYALDRDREQLEWSLDDEYANDLEYARGHYRLEPADEGYVRVVYVFEVASGHVAPLWLRRRLTKRGVNALLSSIRDAAERAHRAQP